MTNRTSSLLFAALIAGFGTLPAFADDPAPADATDAPAPAPAPKPHHHRHHAAVTAPTPAAVPEAAVEAMPTQMKAAPPPPDAKTNSTVKAPGASTNSTVKAPGISSSTLPETPIKP